MPVDHAATCHEEAVPGSSRSAHALLALRPTRQHNRQHAWHARMALALRRPPAPRRRARRSAAARGTHSCARDAVAVSRAGTRRPRRAQGGGCARARA